MDYLYSASLFFDHTKHLTVQAPFITLHTHTQTVPPQPSGAILGLNGQSDQTFWLMDSPLFLLSHSCPLSYFLILTSGMQFLIRDIFCF